MGIDRSVIFLVAGLLVAPVAASGQGADAIGKVVRRGGYGIHDLFGFGGDLGEARLPQLLSMLSSTQRDISTKQLNLLEYQRTTGGSDRTQTFVQERLRDLLASQADNTRLYGQLRDVVGRMKARGTDLAAVQPKLDAAEAAQRSIEASYAKLGEAFGPFWQGQIQAASAASTSSGAAGSASPGAPVPAPAGGAQGAGPRLVPPTTIVAGTRPLTPPRLITASGSGDPAATASGPGPAMTQANQMQPVPVHPADTDAAYRETLARIQSILSSETADSAQKQAAYQQFLQIKAAQQGRRRK